MGNMTKFATPAGAIKFAHLVKPNTKFNPDGNFELSLVFNSDDPKWLELNDKIQKAMKESEAEAIEEINKGKNPGAIAKKKAELKGAIPYSDEYDDSSNPTGSVILKLKRPAKTKEGVINTIKIFDAKNNDITGKVNPGRESIVKAAGYLRPYYMPSTNTYGLSIGLTAIQILKLVEFGGGAEFEEDAGFEYQPDNNEINDSAEDGSLN